MSELVTTLEQFHFLRPYWLLALIPAVILFALLWHKRAYAGEWKRSIAPHLLTHLMQGSQTRDSKAPLLLLLIAWWLASLAMAGPTWEKLPAALKKKADARVIVLDLTLSMLASDMPPSRLTRAKHKLSDILARSKEGVTGLVVFAGSAHVVSPLTDDANTVLSLASSLTPEIMPISGSDPIAGIKKAHEVLEAGGFPDGQILFIGDDLPANYATELDALKGAITLSILAVGTGEGAPIAVGSGRYLKDASGGVVMAPVDHARMQQASALFGGRYSALTADDSDINLLLADFLNLDDDIRETQREFDLWDDAGGWVALLILPLAALGYRKGWLGALWLPLILSVALAPTPAAHADTWDTLWKNNDQRAKNSFDAQRFDEAAEQFQDPAWRAGALYKSGKYAEAEALYNTLPGADAHYNRGNALAQQGKLDEAITAYDEALKLDPTLEDAKTNQETVKRLKAQQPPPQQQQGGDGKPGESDQQDDSQAQNPEQTQENGDPSQNGAPENQQNASPQNDGSQNHGASDPSSTGQDENTQDEKQASSGASDKDKEESEANSRNDAPQPQEEGDTGNNDMNAIPAPTDDQAPKTEDEQAMEQWLRRVPDDPGGLLRRKFYYESRLRRNNENQNGTQW